MLQEEMFEIKETPIHVIKFLERYKFLKCLLDIPTDQLYPEAIRVREYHINRLYNHAK